MKASFITSRQSLFLFFVFTLVAATFIIFYFKHVDDKKDQLIQRNFRQLNAVSTAIQSRVAALSTAIATTVNDSNNNSIKKISDKLISLISNLDSSDVSINRKHANSVWFEERNDSLLLKLRKKYSKYYIMIKVKGIDEIITKKKNQDLFDDCFLATNTGYVIPSSKTMSISTIKKVVELNKKDSVNFLNISSSDAIAQYTLGGEEYMLFIHPARLYASLNGKVKKQWTICGIIRMDKFQSESQAVSANVILAFIAIIILIVLAWPLLKLRFASRYEHIRTSDIIIASLSLLFIAAVLTLSIMDIFVSVYQNNNVDTNLNSLAVDMGNNFRSEIKKIDSELTYLSKTYDKKLHSNKVKQYLTVDTLNAQQYPYFDMVAWINYKTGMQEYKLLMKEKRTTFVPVKNREYYKNIVDSNVWNFSNTKGIFIQPIISWTTGDFLTTLSKKVKFKNRDYVGAIDFLPISVYSPVLPIGYSFCIMDDNGQVIFHSNSDRNFQENFFTECNNCRNIKAAIKSKSKEYLDTDYWGKEIRGMIYPIEGIPWNIVMMYDKSILSANNVLMISLSSSLFMLYLIPFFIFVIIFMTFKSIQRNSIWPQIEKADIYLRLMIIFILFSLILIFYYATGKDLNNIFIATWLYPHSAIVLSFIIIVSKLRRNETKDDKNLWILFSLVTIIDIGLIFLILKENNFPLKNSLLTFIIWIFATLFGAYVLFDKSFIERKALKPEKIWKSEKTIQKATKFYVLAFTSFLILGAILPTIGFFKIAFQTEIKTNIKLSELDYYQKKKDRLQELADKYNPADYSFAKELFEIRIKDRSDIYLPSNAQKPNIPIIKKNMYKDTSSSWLDTAIIYEIIPNFHRGNIDARAFLHKPCFIYNFNTASFYINDINPPKNNVNHYLIDTITTSIPNLQEAVFTSSSKGKLLLKFLFLIFIVLILIYLFYSVILYIIKSAFLINANDLTYFMQDNIFIKETTNNILLLSNDKCLAERISREILCHEEENKKAVRLLCINMSDIISKDYQKANPVFSFKEEEQNNQIVIIDNFEYDFANPEINSKKLLFLEEEVYVKKNKLIVLSSVNPIGGFALYKPKEEEKVQKEILNRWDNIFSGFVSLSWYYTSNDINSTLNILEELSVDKNFSIENSPEEKRSFFQFFRSLFLPDIPAELLIEQELNNNITLDFHPELKSIAKKLLRIDKDEVLNEKTLGTSSFFDIAMEKTRSYHQKLWDSCSTGEKIVLMRLAKDKFLPVSNIKVVETLFRRGLIKREPNLKPFNIFFAKLIREADFYEEDFLNKKETQNGWTLFRIPILLVFVGIVIFLFATQSEIYQSTLAIIPAITIMIPFALKLLGMFQSKQVISKDAG